MRASRPDASADDALCELFARLLDVDPDTVSLVGPGELPERLERDDADALVVLLDTGRAPLPTRLGALLTRDRDVARLRRTLSGAGYRASGSYALYPSATRTNVVYERGTPGGRYAEAVLLPRPPGRLRRWLHAATRRTSFGSSAIDVVAVVGVRP